MKPLTSFQRRVYTVVKQIPMGQVRTYAWVARKVNRPGAARAVGNALNRNPFPIIVPCHRVVRSKGSLPTGRQAVGGYVFGKDLKRQLLEIERVKFGFRIYYAIRDKRKIENPG